MNINNITFESFKEIYEYLVYKRQNINKFIQNNINGLFLNNLISSKLLYADIPPQIIKSIFFPNKLFISLLFEY